MDDTQSPGASAVCEEPATDDSSFADHVHAMREMTCDWSREELVVALTQKDDGLFTLRSALAAERAAGEDAQRLLDAIRKRCKVIYFGADWHEYPIEHNPFAQKDMWDAIVAKLTGSMFVNDRMLAADRETGPSGLLRQQDSGEATGSVKSAEPLPGGVCSCGHDRTVHHRAAYGNLICEQCDCGHFSRTARALAADRETEE